MLLTMLPSSLKRRLPFIWRAGNKSRCTLFSQLSKALNTDLSQITIGFGIVGMMAGAVMLLSLPALAAESGSSTNKSGVAVDVAGLEGRVKIDGSSTVYPITEAAAEEFQAKAAKVKITIGISGTGGGFKKFVAGETDINNASRPIKSSEQDKATSAGIKVVELPVAYDGLSVVVHPKNDWVSELTTDQLNKLWEPGSKIKLWSDLNPKWPSRAIKLYGPGADSGTFDYFTEKVNGKSRASRSDYTASEDDSVLVKGVSRDKDSLGYFGFAYYEENKEKLKVLALKDGDNKGVPPNPDTIVDGSYYLARPVFIYVSSQAAKKPSVKAFVEFYLTEAKNLTRDVGYVALSDSAYGRALDKFRKFTLEGDLPNASADHNSKGSSVDSGEKKSK